MFCKLKNSACWGSSAGSHKSYFCYKILNKEFDVFIIIKLKNKEFDVFALIILFRHLSISDEGLCTRMCLNIGTPAQYGRSLNLNMTLINFYRSCWQAW